MKNIKCLLAYDGSCFFGWQATKTGPSIEETVKNALEQILQQPIILQAASRTDRGVHAQGQVINFFLKQEPVDYARLLKSTNALLPPSIRILHIEEAPLNFHPTLDAISKTYRYQICYGPVQNPLNRFFSWHVPYILDLEAMQKGASLLQGFHDFSAFCNQRKGLPYKDKKRSLFQITFQQMAPNQLYIYVEGDHFLYKMVRNLVGTLVLIGRGKLSLESLPTILLSKDRKQAGVTAPSHGLSLEKIIY